MPTPSPCRLRRRAPGRAAAAQSEAPLDPVRFGPTALQPLRVRARRLAAATVIEPHRHPWAQVAFSATGVLRVTAAEHTYIVPPSRAVWIPPGVEHVVMVVQDAELRTLYLRLPPGQQGPTALDGHAASAPPGAPVSNHWQHCRVLEVSPLLRELVEQLHALADVPPQPRQAVLAALAQDELQRARSLSLGLGMPSDKRLRALCEAVLDEPARHASLGGWAREAGASPRTVARLFRQDLDTTYAQWRQQALLAKALALAAGKRPMAHIAAELGYASASAFSAMVRRAVGAPPSRFFAAQ